MFLTRPSVSQSVSQSVSPVFLVSATPLKPVNRISWNIVVMKDIMCRCAYPQEIFIQFFFSWNYALFELNERYYSKQFVSATPIKPLKRISWNFVVLKDLMCRCAYPPKIFIYFFLLELRPLFKLEMIKMKDTTQNSLSVDFLEGICRLI